MKGEARPLPTKSVCNTLLFCLVSPSLIPSVEQHGHRFFGTSDTVKCLVYADDISFATLFKPLYKPIFAKIINNIYNLSLRILAVCVLCRFISGF